MTDGTTTIEITEEQKANLEARKNADRESMKSVLGRVLADNPQDDISDQLDRIEAAAKEATNAAQTTQATVEELTSQ